MALYEYQCSHCGARFDKRMSMSDVLQLVPCPECGKQAAKTMGGFAVGGRAQAGVADGPAPWEEGGTAADPAGPSGHSHTFDHSHDHGGAGHTH